MNNINSLPDDIPETTHSFQLDLIGSVTKKRYLGEFVCKIPTIKDQTLIGVHEAKLNGEFPIYLNEGVKKMHKWVSYLRFTLIDIPKFWRDSDLGFDLRDPNVIESVYDEVIAFENEWYHKIWGNPEEPNESGEKEKA